VPGANDHVPAASAVAAVEQVRPSVVIGQFEIPQEVTAAAFRAARSIGAVTILNPAPAAQGRFTSLRQPQLGLTPFDEERLKNVAVRLRELYPAQDRGRLMERVSDAFLDRLVTQVTEGFKGDVGVVPRQFLREFVNQMDTVDEHEDYVPMEQYGFNPGSENLLPEEQSVVSGAVASSLYDDDADIAVPQEDVW
jgi:hypothetical protein